MPNKSKMHLLVVIALCGVAVSAVGMPVLSSGVFITPIANDLGVYRGSVSMHNTLTLITKALMSLYVSRLLQKYSMKKVLTVGAILAGVSNYLLGWTTSIWIFNLLGLLRGTGAGLIAWVPVTIIINEWFNEKHGLVTSVVLSFSSIGGAIFSPVFENLIHTLGWAAAYRWMGVAMILFTLPILLLPFTLNPRDCGYLPYGSTEDTEDKLKKRRVVQNEGTSGVSGVLFGMMFVFALLQTMLTGVSQHFPGFTETIGHSSAVGATMLSIAMVSSVGFKLGMGTFSDYIGSVKSTLSIIALVAIASLILIVTDSIPILYVSSILYGAVFSVPSVSITLLTREFFGKYQFARLFPILAFATSIGGAISISLVGYIFDFTGSYLPAFAFSLVANIVNFGILMLISKKVKSV